MKQRSRSISRGWLVRLRLGAAASKLAIALVVHFALGIALPIAAICVLVAVPLYAIVENGVAAYLRQYLQPTFFMLPFNIIGELSRTLALAVRLYGNVMSGTIIIAILIGVVPFFFPIVMELLGLLTGIIQAYIFAILAMVYIASAAQVEAAGAAASDRHEPNQPS